MSDYKVKEMEMEIPEEAYTIEEIRNGYILEDNTELPPYKMYFSSGSELISFLGNIIKEEI